ncbi:MAG: extracellular solute-binding protein [Alphaproteobacteria bacterium]|nr:extracellular solute-binding protein [Alphaproteobacteria bacterium]
MQRRPLLIAAVAASLLAASPAVAQSGRVVVYNAGGPDLFKPLSEAFAHRHPQVKIDVINAGVGELFTRIRAERSNPRGDVLLGASGEAFVGNTELFQPYKAKEHDVFDPKVVGPDNTFYGFSMPLQALIVNTRLMPLDQAPKSWKDLGEPRYKGKIIMSNPSLSGSAYGQIAQILQLHGWDLVSKIVTNATFVAQSAVVFQNVAKGEYAIGLTGDSNIVTMAQQGHPVAAVYPSEGTALRFDASGIIKGGPNPDNARLFLDFVNTKEAHAIVVKTNRRSVRADVAAPSGQIPTGEIKTFAYDDAAAARDRKTNLEKFDDLLSRK